MQRPDWFGDVPHNRWFAWGMGLIAGITTMLANAAGPIFALYALAVALPKFEIVGTSAWFFFIINSFKVPFSLGLGLIHGQTLLLNLVLSPVIVAGVFGGRWIITRIPQRMFDAFLLAFAAHRGAEVDWRVLSGEARRETEVNGIQHEGTEANEDARRLSRREMGCRDRAFDSGRACTAQSAVGLIEDGITSTVRMQRCS